MKILLKKFNYLLIGLLIIFGFIIYSNIRNNIHTIKESFDNIEKIKVINDADNINISNYDIVTEYKNNKKDNLQDIINKINFDTSTIIKSPYKFVNEINVEKFTNNDPKNSLYSPPVDCNSTLDCNSVIMIENKLGK
jgi:hypothetical protein